MSAVAHARTRSVRRPATIDRRALKVVQRPNILRRVTPSAVVALTVVTAFAFAALAAHISLIDEQGRLDSLRSSIVTEQIHQEDLRRQEAGLENPDEVIRLATTEFGMVAAAPAEIVPAAHTVIGVPPVVGDSADPPPVGTSDAAASATTR